MNQYKTLDPIQWLQCITVQTILPKMRDIEGNLKKRYVKLAAKIWVGPCHWIKTQSDIAIVCLGFPMISIRTVTVIYGSSASSSGANCAWLVTKHKEPWDGKRRRSDVSSVFSFPPSFAPIRERLLGTRKGRPIYYRTSVSIIWNSSEEVSCWV